MVLFLREQGTVTRISNSNANIISNDLLQRIFLMPYFKSESNINLKKLAEI